jgi:cell division septation protein DedD
MTGVSKPKGTTKGGTRTRTSRSRGGVPRIMWLAIMVIVAGAVFLFRQGGDDVPTGIGERRTVVTSEASYQSPGEENPRSGDVNIEDADKTLVPEQAEGGAAAANPATKPAETTQKETTKPATTTKKTVTTPEPKPDPVRPNERGPYVVQIGSFGSSINADKEAARVKKAGWDALVKVGNTSDGTIIYRVRVGYFKSRADAETFIRENRKAMSGAIAVHR